MLIRTFDAYNEWNSEGRAGSLLAGRVSGLDTELGLELDTDFFRFRHDSSCSPATVPWLLTLAFVTVSDDSDSESE